MESQTNVYGTLLDNLRRRGIVETPEGEGPQEKGKKQESVGDYVIRIVVALAGTDTMGMGVSELSAKTQIDFMELVEILRVMERASLVSVDSQTVTATRQGNELARLGLHDSA